MHLASGTPAAPEWLKPGTIWRLTAPLNLYSQPTGAGLATQAWEGRQLQILAPTAAGGPGQRLRVRLLEDGYPGWIGCRALLGHALAGQRQPGRGLHRCAILQRLGPDYDCSGLVQRAYASTGIWIPRDAYLQERFCQPVGVQPGQSQLLLPGDLIFFGSPQRCSHVGLHLGGGSYLHSSGQAHGRNGIGIDTISPHNPHPVARHYLGELRGAGRVMHSHGGSPMAA
jgi:cell wall-associated NlpC family hydrolase